MPFPTPTLAQTEERLRADTQSRLPGTDPLLRRSFVGAFVRGIAGAVHLLFGYIGWIARQAFPDTAEDAELLRWAAIWGVTPVAATEATGTLSLTGTNGTVVPSGTVWRSGDDIDYETTAEVTIAAGVATADVDAVVAGAGGNAAVGVLRHAGLADRRAGLGGDGRDGARRRAPISSR